MEKDHYVDAGSQSSPLVTSEELRAQELERNLAEKSIQLERAQRKTAEQENYISTLSNQLSDAQGECDEVRHSARGAIAHKDDLIMQRNLRLENSQLKKQLDDVSKQRRNINLAQTDSLGPSEKIIRDGFAQIKVELENDCSSLDITLPTTASIHEMQVRDGDEAVESWTWHLAHGSFNQLISSAMENNVSEFDVVRGLAAVGVCDMAFESNFPHLMAKESPILHQYRKQLFIAVGPQTLFEVDILAHQSLMAEPYFQSKSIEGNAVALAGKLCGILTRLMSPGVSSPQRPSSQRSEDSNPFSEAFKQAFVLALQLKSTLLLSKRKYKLVYFRPGDLFSPDRMVQDHDLGDQVDRKKIGPIRCRIGKGRRNSDALDKPIKLCLFPALYSVPDETKDLEQSPLWSDIRQCVVGYGNFINGAVRDCEVLVVKAVVLV